VPELPWDQLADRFSKAVATNSEALEHAVVQYVDGDLATEQRTALEQRLADDAHGATLLKQHEKLHSALRRLPFPRIHWKNLTTHLVDAVDELANPAPIKLFGPWIRTVGGFAVAACVLLASGLMLHQRFASHEMHSPANAPVAMDIHVNTLPVTSNGPALTDISIGAGANVASNTSSTEYADGIVGVQRSRGLIATQSGSEQDIPLY
jgi:anti-sigma factor RsiW